MIFKKDFVGIQLQPYVFTKKSKTSDFLYLVQARDLNRVNVSFRVIPLKNGTPSGGWARGGRAIPLPHFVKE